MADPKPPTPSDRAPNVSAPFQMPSPFPAPEPEPAPKRGRKALWTVLTVLLAAAAKYFLATQGVPAPVAAPLVDEATKQLEHVLPK